MEISRIKKYYKINHRIKEPEIRVITREGKNLGVLRTSEALRLAETEGLDLVLISEGTKPPIAKILDFSKFLYEERKKASQSKAKSKKSELKEFRIRPSIGMGDIEIRIKRAIEFIKEGNRVRITVQLRGREKAHPEVGFEKIEIIGKGLEEVAKLEKKPQNINGRITATFVKG